ncbi:amino acid permease [Streptomyces bauhiniae]|uniref:amino acid permease n=1 Tax=Streptomyces bauhiniae TaxID=2340725 RepID=UPI0035E2D44C
MQVTGTAPPPAPATDPLGAPAEEPGGTATKHARRFGLPVATALVMGNIIGGGIFLLPASVAPYGTVSLVALGVLTVGAIALALVFGRLAQRDPRTGGPYVYAREAFGDFAGFLAAWAYWITTWVSNAALAVAAVGYLDVLIPVSHHRWTACLAALVIQWLPALTNFAGTRWVGAVQLVSTVLKFVPLLLVAVGGLFFFDPDKLGPFNPGGGSPVGAISASAALLLYSYLGVESAAVSAGEVRDARRNVGRATVIGTDDEFLVLLNTFQPDENLDTGTPADRAQADTWGRVPKIYVRLADDASMPLALQDRLIREGDALTPDNPYDVRTLPGSHLKWLVDPAPAARVLGELAVLTG